MTLRSRINRFLFDRAGATAVEFALVSVAFFTVIMGITYVAMMLFTNVSLDFAVQRAARVATLNHSVTQSAISQTINNYLASVGLSNATVTYSVTTSNSIQTANIAASYTQAYSLPFVSTFNITFSSNTAVPLSS